METTKTGWSYISAIFKMLLDKCDENNLVEPQFIYRGITKRFFSRSKTIENDINFIKERYKLYSKGKDRIKEFYKLSYEKLKKDLKNGTNKGKDPYELLRCIMEEECYKYIVPEYIKSGAAVRMQQQSVSSTPQIDYVNYIKHMLNDIKNRFPIYIDENYSDVEILADLQHKGAASCLVDFSNNFLTSLWFATETHNDDIGYLFCYDINKEMIEEDKLSVLDPIKKIDCSIEELLHETTKTTRYSGNRSYKFWLWKPSNLNERIARQDSIFVFGIEAFKVDEHRIITIPIPPDWKKPIQHVLKSIMGITAESIYCDVDGYADANSKTKPYEKNTLHFFSEKYDSDTNNNSIADIQDGMACLFQCEYELALKYFTQYESKTNKIFDRKNITALSLYDESAFRNLKNFVLNMEVHYSKGLCLKHMGNKYAAIEEFENAQDSCCELHEKVSKQISYYNINDAKDNFKNELEHLLKYQKYIENKQQKTFNDLMDMYYDTYQYDKVIDIIHNKKEQLLDHDDNNLESLYTTIEREAICLNAIMGITDLMKNKNTERRNISFALPEYQFGQQIQPFYYVLNQYFDYVINILKNNKKSNNAYQRFVEIIENGSAKEFNSSNYYTNWNLADMIYLIDKMKDVNLCLYKDLMTATSRMIDFINYVQGKIRIDPW